MATEDSLIQDNNQSLIQLTNPTDLLLQQQNERSPNQLTSSKSSKTDNLQFSNQDAAPEAWTKYPKAGLKLSKKGRKRGRSCIATDTPIKQEFQEAAKKEKLRNAKRKPLLREMKNNEISKKSRKCFQKPISKFWRRH
ncbi:hypothetical protein ACJJTC_008098 [Scirpophaga incertulas]